MSFERRAFLTGALVLGLGSCSTLERNVLEPIKKIKVDPVDRSLLNQPEARLRMIEASADGMLGVSLFDTATGKALELNADRRFGHASSFKTTLAAMVLARDAAGSLDADKRVTWGERDLLGYAPFARERLKDGATLRELAQHTQTLSDNTAANLLLAELGGPQAVTDFWRSIGDETSRLDRTEPTLNNVPIAEVRDTTTPAAMAKTLGTLLYGDVMPEAQRATLRQWMIDTTTGLKRVRAGIRTDKGWVVGDKTGTSFWPGMGSLYVDIGFAEPPPAKYGPRAPVAFAAYFRANATHTKVDPKVEAMFANLGDVVRDFVIEDDGLPF